MERTGGTPGVLQGYSRGTPGVLQGKWSDEDRGVLLHEDCGWCARGLQSIWTTTTEKYFTLTQIQEWGGGTTLARVFHGPRGGPHV